jgi:hypothetical protein
LSLRGGPRGNSGRKGSNGQRSERRKRQEFHRHKLRPVTETNADVVHLKQRTIIALEHLGEQRFSAEIGAYGIQDWLKNFKTVLHEFEEVIDAAIITPAYVKKKNEVIEVILTSADVSQLDEEIQRVHLEQRELTDGTEARRVETIAKIDSLRREKAKCSKELEEEKRKLSEVGQSERSTSIMSRLFGTKSSTPDRSRLSQLESTILSLETEINELHQSLSRHKRFKVQDDEQHRQDSLRARLEALENDRQRKLQVLTERKEAAAQMVGFIAELKLATG